MTRRTTVPLFPLPGVVHFPKTELKLHIFEPRYQQLIRDLQARDRGDRLIGMATLEAHGSGRASIYRSGTAGELIEVEPLEDGRSNIVLLGAFRFEIEQEVESPTPYRQARVIELEEKSVSPETEYALAQDVWDLSKDLKGELGERFPLTAERLSEFDHSRQLEELVNEIAANLALPTEHRIGLLGESLETRAISVLSMLRNQQSTLDLLRPFRGLAASPELN